MNDFEFQRRLRELNVPRIPSSDLWPAIAERIGSADIGLPVAGRRRGWLPVAAAAGVLLAIVGAALLQDLPRRESAPGAVATTSTSTQDFRISPRAARDAARVHGSDPRLAGAVLVLDAAHDELAEALERRPDAVFLVSLLNRTNTQRMKLDHFGAYAG